MNLSASAESQGISDLTAYRWYQAGTMPVRCYQAPSGTIIVHLGGTACGDNQPPVPAAPGGAALYAHVAGHDRHDELERQPRRWWQYAKSAGLCGTGEVEEIGSGLNGHRRRLASGLAAVERRVLAAASAMESPER